MTDHSSSDRARDDLGYTLALVRGMRWYVGTGKTLLVEKLAAESGLPLLCLAPSSVLSKWAGDSEKTLKKVTTCGRIKHQNLNVLLPYADLSSANLWFF